MLVHGIRLGITAVLAASFASAAAAGCQLQQLGTLPIDMEGLHPMVKTRINGIAARFELDSGSFYSMIWRGAASRYRLPVRPVMGDSYYVSGMGGSEKASETTVRSFQFLGFPVSNAKFLVVNGGGSAGESVGLIGENLLRVSDVEYDLANGVVRFFKPTGCNGHPLAYWAVSTPYTSVKLDNLYVADYHLSATAIVDGHRMTVWLDTGSPRSFLSLSAAARIGITPDSPGVTFLGTGGGIGPGVARMWDAPIQSFQLGGEKVEHAHMLLAHFNHRSRFADLTFGNSPDMLLGDDFFLSQRIYVAYSQKRIYFTYNGGPLFNLNLPEVISGKAAPPAAPAAGAGATATAGVDAQPGTTADAARLRRRGMARAAMRQFDRALADLTRACALAPGDALNHYDRGLVYAEDSQFASALEDYAAAIKLSPDDIDARMARVRLLQSHPDAAPVPIDIESELAAISRLAAPADDVRLALAEMYGKQGDYAAGVAQIDQWLEGHPLKVDQARGLNERCWLRATSNRELRGALEDCNHALDLVGGRDMDLLDSRGLVYLRLGRPNAAINDYDDALDISPGMATSLYGRALAELRLGRQGQARKDFSAAESRDARIVQYFAKMGLSP